MRHPVGRPLIGAAALYAAASFWSAPAFAITNQQFTTMCQAHVGLRSATAAARGAGYSFDDGVSATVCVIGPVPTTWDATLAATIHYIFGQSGYESNNLYLLSPCAGTGERYQGSFPKCNSVGQDPHVYAETAIGQKTEAEVITWVTEQINAHFP